jgi:two-component system cell cycle sensor histidine kinase/response regulator CckA
VNDTVANGFPLLLPLNLHQRAQQERRPYAKHRLTFWNDEDRCAEQRHRLLFENAADLITVLTPEGVIVEINQRSRDLLGLAPEQMMGRNVREFAIPGEEEALTAGCRESVEKGLHRRVVALRHPDGTVKQIEFSTNLVELDGEARLFSVGRDVTENRRLEESLRQAQKMEALGQLTGGIAHDFNNMLTVIIANSYLLLNDLGSHDPRREDVEQIRGAANRGAGLTRQLLAFSRGQVIEPIALDLNDTIGNLKKMLSRLIGEDIDLSFTAAHELGTVLADVGQIEQLVMNLVVNARDAMPAGGRLSLETANVDADDVAAARDLAGKAGRFVLLTVTDSGSGMSAETKRRLFEPFFTTKEVGKGTGLGLATCYGIVQQSGGSIVVDSDLGKGTVFKVYLPRVDERPEPAALPMAELGLRGTETLLLIEDDVRVRAGVARILRGYGYRVQCARNGNEAAAIARRRDVPIDLVLSDVVIPNGNGPEAVRDVQRCWPAAKALLMSGYSDHLALRRGGPTAGPSFIQKPFAPEALALKIRAALDG